MEAARSGEAGPVWFVTDAQSAARGRRGNVWSHPPGNLGATFLRTYRLPPKVTATLGFVAGLALDAALRRHQVVGFATVPDGGADGANRFALKWPNDMLAGGAKLAGILLEAETLPGGATAVAVGIGVNVIAAPEGLPYPATSLAALGVDATAPSVFGALTDAWIGFENLWNDGEGLAAVRAAWLERAAGLGAPVAVRMGETVVRGVFETLDEQCRMMVRTGEGLLAVSAGEVHFGTVATAR